ncbi:hypothetical protein HWV62_26318 [Athelia sp. TMB]|nr:hypothetical protein HWV62_26318 [Athelia sp. TMB]
MATLAPRSEFVTGTMPTVLDLNTDIWLAVSLLLPVDDLARLQATCRHLRAVLSLDYVWRAVLKDIRTVVADPDDAPHALSSSELQHRAMRAARIERYWGQPAVVVAQSSIRTMHISTGHTVSTIIEARLVKGGQWIVLLSEEGALCLRSTQGREWRAEELSFASPDDSGVEMTLSLSAGTRKETLVLLRRSSWDAAGPGSPSTTIAIYLVETNVPEPRFRLLTKVTRHHSRAYENSVVAEGSLWAFGWAQNGRQLLSVKNILWSQDDVEKEVLLDIGEPIHVCSKPFHPEGDTDALIQASLSLLSETQVLVTSCYKCSCYEIPPLQVVPPGQQAPIIRQEPLWTTSYQDKYNYPPMGPVCWDAVSGRHEGRLAMLTGTTLRFYTPAPEPSMTSSWIRTYSPALMEARPALSDRRVLWSAGRRLFVCTFPMPPGGERGWLRLGAQAEAEEVHVASVALPRMAVDGKIVDLSWDEAAGRLCLLVLSPALRSLGITIVDTPAL